MKCAYWAIEYVQRDDKNAIRNEFVIFIILCLVLLTVDVVLMMVKKPTLKFSCLNWFLPSNGINYDNFIFHVCLASTCWLLLRRYPFDRTMLMANVIPFKSLFQVIIIPNLSRKQFQWKTLNCENNFFNTFLYRAGEPFNVNSKLDTFKPFPWNFYSLRKKIKDKKENSKLIPIRFRKCMQQITVQ